MSRRGPRPPTGQRPVQVGTARIHLFDGPYALHLGRGIWRISIAHPRPDRSVSRNEVAVLVEGENNQYSLSLSKDEVLQLTEDRLRSIVAELRRS